MGHKNEINIYFIQKKLTSKKNWRKILDKLFAFSELALSWQFVLAKATCIHENCDDEWKYVIRAPLNFTNVNWIAFLALWLSKDYYQIEMIKIIRMLTMSIQQQKLYIRWKRMFNSNGFDSMHCTHNRMYTMRPSQKNISEEICKFMFNSIQFLSGFFSFRFALSLLETHTHIHIVDAYFQFTLSLPNGKIYLFSSKSPTESLSHTEREREWTP